MSTQRVIQFQLNGEPIQALISSQDTLIDLLGDHCGLRGARESCGQGLCGCCTVYVNDMPVSGCLSLAWFADGASIRTIEGLAGNDTLDPVQEAFIEAGAFQCGFCTSGFILMTKKLLEKDPNPSDDTIRHYLIGNLCRCSAYPEIIKAVHIAAQKMRDKRS
jgi:aerobic carbon-monoxide dehydrogenase small subunit